MTYKPTHYLQQGKNNNYGAIWDLDFVYLYSGCILLFRKIYYVPWNSINDFILPSVASAVHISIHCIESQRSRSTCGTGR